MPLGYSLHVTFVVKLVFLRWELSALEELRGKQIRRFVPKLCVGRRAVVLGGDEVGGVCASPWERLLAFGGAPGGGRRCTRRAE